MVAARSALARRRLAGPDLPVELSYIWRWFLELHSARQLLPSGGVQPIGWDAMDAWTRLTGARPSPWEIELLREIDMTWLMTPAPDDDTELDDGSQG